MNIAIYTLTSPLHDESAVAAATREFLDTLTFQYDFRGEDFSDYGTCDLSLIYVRTGGTEGVFRRIFADKGSYGHSPVYLLTSGKSNSLAASMEILSYLRQHGVAGEIIHGSAEYINSRVSTLSVVARARRSLQGCRLGVIGQPSDWLISSGVDRDIVKQRLGVTLVDIPISELIDHIDDSGKAVDEEMMAKAPTDAIRKSLPGAEAIYFALRAIVAGYGLSGLTLRCFDLLTAVSNTGCVALARLNSEGVVAGCEGDIPAMLTMAVSRALTGLSGFQANPARIDVETGEMLFAHCTIPLNMVDGYDLDTHFESGIGVGVRGYMPLGRVTIFKMSGDLSRFFVEEGTLVRNQAEPDLCRTQQIIRLDDPAAARYFLTNPIGNHHIILPGRWKSAITELLG